ncbi:MAG: cytochrome P450, partial [Gammaproteobacteria bacterium]
LGLAMITFARHPKQWRLLAQRPELASTAVEELMRVNPATPVVGRVASEDFTFQGVDIPAGTHLGLFLATANTQPDTFGDTPFDITAQRTAQLTFRRRHPLLPRRLAGPPRDARGTAHPGVPAR